MYFKTITPLVTLNESLNYTMKNLIDTFSIPMTDYGKYIDEKLKRREAEFNSLYRYDSQVESVILDAIKDIESKQKCDVIDIPKLDHIFHLKLRIQLDLRGDSLSRADLQKFYTALYRELYVGSLPSYYSKYTVIKFIDGKYIIFITFDENGVEAVHTVVSENQFDISAAVELAELKINKNIFKK